MEPVKTGVWSSCTVNEFVNNSNVSCFINGSIYILSDFSTYGEKAHLRALRIYNTKSGEWSILPYEQWRNIAIIGKTLLFKYRPKKENNQLLYAYSLQQMDKSNFQVRVPDWAVHHEMSIANGKIINVYWSRQKLEVWDDTGLLFRYNQYQISRETNNNIQYVHEKGIIFNFKTKNNFFIVDTIDKTSLESNWEQFAVVTGGEFVESTDVAKKRKLEFSFPKRDSIEIRNKLIFNLNGQQVFDEVKESNFDEVSDEVAISAFVAHSKSIGTLYQMNDLPNILTHEEKNWTAIWSPFYLTVRNSDNYEVLFSSRFGNNSDVIDKVFFEGDTVGVIVYECKRNQVESGFDYCSGPTDYLIDEEFRENYRILYFGLDGSLLKQTELKDTKEYHDHKRMSVQYPRIISVKGGLVAKARPDNSLTFENPITKVLHTFPNSPCLESNNRFLITKDLTCYSLSEGQSKVCSIPKPWSSINLFGSYLAITRPTKEVNIINLETGLVEFEAQTEDVPVKICGFMYKKSEEDFLAVQYDRFIKIWYRAHP